MCRARIGVRPHRSALGVVPELAEFLGAAAGFGDLRGPLDGDHAHWKLNADQRARPWVAIGHYVLRSADIAEAAIAVRDR